MPMRYPPITCTLIRCSSTRYMPIKCMPTIDHVHKMHTYNRSCLLKFLIYERHTYKRLISIREVYLRAIYIYERSMPTYRRVSYRRVFQSVHLRGVHLMSGRVSQGVRILWACFFRGHASQRPASYPLHWRHLVQPLDNNP
jgi:hypothetical protein